MGGHVHTARSWARATTWRASSAQLEGGDVEDELAADEARRADGRAAERAAAAAGGAPHPVRLPCAHWALE